MKRLIIAPIALLAALSAQAATLSPITLLNPAGSTSGQAIISTGSSAAPVWGNVGAGSLATQAANTVVANVTASSASPTAVAIPGCNTSTSSLQYTSGTGFSCYASSATTTGTLAQFAATTSAQLAGVISDETGTGSLVFGNGPAITNATIAGSAGSFTTLSASSAVSGAGFSTYLASPPAIGGTAAAAGSFTSLAASGTVSGTGFTNLFASPPAIGGTAPAAGSFTTVSASGGMVGVTNGSSAAAGTVGEYLSSSVPVGSAVSMTNATAKDAASISLTAGDWNVWGTCYFHPGSTTASNQNICWISTTSATLPASPNGGARNDNISAITVGGGDYSVPAGMRTISVSTTTPVYLSGYSAFATSTNALYGFIGARRVR